MTEQEHLCELHDWKNIGQVSTGNGALAILPPYYANTLGQWWDRRVPTLPDDRMGNFESVSLEQVTTNRRGRSYKDQEQAMLVTCDNGIYDIEARFCDLYGDGHLTICELRIVLHNVEHQDDDEP